MLTLVDQNSRLEHDPDRDRATKIMVEIQNIMADFWKNWENHDIQYS